MKSFFGIYLLLFISIFTFSSYPKKAFQKTVEEVNVACKKLECADLQRSVD